MQSFKEYLAQSKSGYEWFTFQVEEYAVHLLFDNSTLSVLTEAKHKGTPLDGQYSAQLHGAHSSVGQQTHSCLREEQPTFLTKQRRLRS